MRSFKVSVDAKKAEFFKELLDSLDFVSYEEDSSFSLTKSERKERSHSSGRDAISSSKRKNKKESELDSIESRRKSLEDIRKAMMNIDKLRNSR